MEITIVLEDEGYPRGVFSSREKAEAAVAKHDAQCMSANEPWRKVAFPAYVTFVLDEDL